VNCPVFDGNTPYTEYLGGTESAIVYLSEQLAILGHNISIFNDIKKNYSIKNVKYYNKSFFLDYSLKNDIDIVIFVRSFLENVKAKIIAFWSEDDYDQALPLLAVSASQSEFNECKSLAEQVLSTLYVP